MSSIDIGIHWVESIKLVPFCEQPNARKTFHLNIETESLCAGRTEKHEISLHVNAASVAKFERIADAINSIMAEDDIADERPLTADETRKIDAAWEKHKAAGPWSGEIRPHNRPDGVPTRIDIQWMTAAELAIRDAMIVVESAGSSTALTDAITLLASAQGRVADHVEDRPPTSIAAEVAEDIGAGPDPDMMRDHEQECRRYERI